MEEGVSEVYQKRQPSRTRVQFPVLAALTVHTLFFAFIYPISKLDANLYLALTSSRYFFAMSSSPLFPIGINNLFSVAVYIAHSFLKVPCMNFCSCSSVTLGYELGVWRKSFEITPTSRGRLWTANPGRIVYHLSTTSALQGAKNTSL